MKKYAIATLAFILLWFSSAIAVEKVDDLLKSAHRSMNKGQYRQAQQKLERANQLDAFNHTIYALLTQVYLAQGKPKDALKTVSQAIALEKKPQYYALRSSIYIQLEQYDEAIPDVTIAIQKNDNAPEYKEMLAYIYYKQSDFKTAETQLTALVPFAYKAPDYLYLLSLVQLNLKKYDEAETQIQKAIIITPAPKYTLLLAALRTHQYKCDGALEAIGVYQATLTPYENPGDIANFQRLHKEICQTHVAIKLPPKPKTAPAPIMVAAEWDNPRPTRPTKTYKVKKQGKTYSEGQLIGIDPIGEAVPAEKYSSVFDAIMQEYKTSNTK